MLKIHESINELSRAAADYIADLSGRAISSRGVFTIALTGGSTPKKLYELLAGENGIDWSKWQVFFSDERFVPFSDERSNYNLAYTSLLSEVPISPDNVHAVDTQAGSPEAAAEAYESTVKSVLGGQNFDLILLGMGSDGHTASLFPGKPALDETQKLVTASAPGILPPPVDRVTFTYPLINAANQVAFLAAGADKAEMIKQALDGGDIPAAKVNPTSGELVWFIDKAASTQI
jgi:6-phosphogluconolactonase